MSSVTMSKTTSRKAAAPPSLQVVPILPAATPVQRRATKKARASVSLVQSVRDVVQAFELEYAQVRAESVELRAALDERRTQLSDLRRHLEKESSENGALEAVVRHRASRNERGAARLRELELAFGVVLAGEHLLESHAGGLEVDLAAFAAEHRRVRRSIGLAAAGLSRAERSLAERERALAGGREESSRLDADVQRRRRAVAEREALLRGEQEGASRAAALAREAAREAAALDGELAGLRRGLGEEEAGSAEATAALAALKENAVEATSRISDAKAARAQELGVAEDRAANLRLQVAAKERANDEVGERVQAAELALAAEGEEQDALRTEIAAMRASREEVVEAEVRRLSGQLEAVDCEVVGAEDAVARSSERMRQANAEFSSLMAAMSVAFREYDQAVTANRELDRDASDTENALRALKDRSQRDLLLLRQKCDSLRASNADLRAAVDGHRRRTGELDAIVRDAQAAVDKAAAGIDSRKGLITARERRLEDGREVIAARREEKGRERLAATEARTAAETEVEAARTLFRQRQSEVIDFDAKAAAWTPPPAALDESDHQRAEEEAAAAVEARDTADGGGRKAHSASVRGLQETLQTIREGGEARLKAEKDAAVARVAVLQEKVLEASRSLVALRARGEAADKMEATLKLEGSRREAERQRRAADEAKTAAAAAAAAKASAAETAAAVTRAQASAAQQIANQAAADQAALPRFETPETTHPTRRSSTHGNLPQPPHRRLPVRGYTQASRREPANAANAADDNGDDGGETAPGGGIDSSFVTPGNRPSGRLSASGVRPPARVVQAARGSGRAVTGSGGAKAGAAAAGDAATFAAAGDRSQHRSHVGGRQVKTIAEPASYRSRSDRSSVEPPRRSSKKPSRSLEKASRSARGQQASESTAEAAGPSTNYAKSRTNASSGRKHSIGGGGDLGGRHRKKDKSSPSSSSAGKPTTTSASNHGSGNGGGSGRDRSRRGGDGDRREKQRRRSSDGSGRGGRGGGGGASSTRKSSSATSKSRSPRHRPRSPRPASNKEYDLWTDNTLVGDSDFSFF